MIAVGHTSVGVLLGLAGAQLLPDSLPVAGQLMIVGVTGVVSHYAMDLLPHGHYDYEGRAPSPSENRRLLVDLVLPIALVGIWLLLMHGLANLSWLIGAGIVGAQLPDVFDGLLQRGIVPKASWSMAEHRFHLATHWHNPQDLTKATNQGGRRLGWADLWQAVVVLMAIVLLLGQH